MLKFIIKKLLFMIPMLIVISALVFFGMELTGTDPINYMVSPDMAANAANIEALRESLGLNDPAFIRYFRWLGDILQGKFGYSIINGQSILDILKSRLPATFELAFGSLILSTILGIGLGLLAAIKQNSIVDYLARILGVIGVSVPQFFFGIVVLMIFAVRLDLLPIGGRIPPGSTGFVSRIPNLILPMLTMAISMTATLLRYTRNSMLDVMNKDYIKTARSKGIPEWKVYLKHAFRNALRPTLVILAFRLPMLIGGSVVIESVFSWPGIGSTILGAVSAGDYPVIMITTMLIAASILAASFLVDVITAALDPRVRLD